ncbi:ABC transporter substrate-binding protein [Aeromicrobium sp. Leaf289]|uniref:MCE family protein n=1 Tax=Aeromicrobium sp. Leaf289 TaxID=1736324 RepID=UPI0006F73658|nr:MCE family protein [Aeromicrobium sp. Leaf289]KQP78331.1 ABC transporter substrate-binding protein [Aeromicrobium sp. Leaf289]
MTRTRKAPRFPTAFAERNRVVIAVVGLLTMAIGFLLAFNAQALPIIGGGSTYQAQFAEAGGLKPGNEVRVAGVKVGEVTGLELDGDTVVVTFRAKDVRVGPQSRAAIKVKTTLGQKFLAVDPLGAGEIDGPIPLQRTSTPYDVNAAFSDLSDTIGEIDTAQLETSLDVLSDTFEDTPKAVRESVAGLTDLSRVVAKRDDELAALLASTREVSGTLKDRNAEFAKLLQDGSSLLEELASRRETVQALLDGTERLGTQLTGLVRDNEEQLRPALAKLDDVAEILQANQSKLEASLRRLGPYYRTLASATGNGPWVDAYICGLFDASGAPELRNDVARDCAPKKGGGQ